LVGDFLLTEQVECVYTRCVVTYLLGV